MKKESSQAALIDPLAQAREFFDRLDVKETTRTEYATRIPVFLAFTKKHGFSPDTFLLFKRQLEERSDYAVATKNKYLAAARIFCKELHRRGILPVDITAGVKSFSQSRKHKREGFTDDEMSKVMDKLRPLPLSQANARLKAIVALLALQGLRQVEVTRLDIKDIDLVRKTAFILGKGRDDKEPIDLHPYTTQILGEYTKACRIADGPLFPSRVRGGRLTTRRVQSLVMDFVKLLGIEGRSTHGFRHWFTSRLVREYRGDLLEVARYTRHQSVEMLMVYNDNVKRKADLPRFHGAFNNFVQ